MITIEELLIAAKERKASDLHVTVGIPPKLRINGRLVDSGYTNITPTDVTAIIEPMLTDATRKVLEKKGEVDFAYSIPGMGRYRTNIFKQRGSYALAMRIVGTNLPNAEDLGLPPSVINLTQKKRGLVMVTGPAGSGKSTTLASLLNIINENYDSHIITLEDPIEFLHNHKRSVVNQREIGLDSESYAGALRAALREDPDVIFVGELRDMETISLALMAAENGHLVFSTQHTIGAANTIERLIDVFPPHQQQQILVQLAAALRTVVSQQLIPMMDGSGRAAVFEVMHTTLTIKNLIKEGKTHQIEAVMQANAKMGMQTMDDAIYEMYQKKKIDSEKALQYAQDPFTMERKLY